MSLFPYYSTAYSCLIKDFGKLWEAPLQHPVSSGPAVCGSPGGAWQRPDRPARTALMILSYLEVTDICMYIRYFSLFLPSWSWAAGIGPCKSFLNLMQTDTEILESWIPGSATGIFSTLFLYKNLMQHFLRTRKHFAISEIPNSFYTSLHCFYIESSKTPETCGNQ